MTDSFLISGDASNGLFLLRGDWNGDGGKTIFDFPTLAYWFAEYLPTAPAYVDLNGDGAITIFDFGSFSVDFGRGVFFPSSPAMYSPRERDDVVNGATASSRRAGQQMEHRIDAATWQHDEALLRVLAEWSKK